MEWSSTLSTLVKFAPGALALIPGVGPIASAAASVLGPSIAQALGVEETPEAVEAAIQAMPAPEAQQIVQDVVARKGNEIGAAIAEAEAKMIAEINQTARAELAVEDKFISRARPTNTYVLAGGTGLYALAVFISAIQGIGTKDWSSLTILLTNAPAFAMAMTPCGAAAGIYTWGRTEEKIAGAAGPLTGLATAVKTAIKGKR
jgi:hypothetical protein